MKPTIFICLFTLVSGFIIAQPELNIQVRIPDDWMEKVRTLGYRQASTELIIDSEKKKSISDKND